MLVEEQYSQRRRRRQRCNDFGELCSIVGERVVVRGLAGAKEGEVAMMNLEMPFKKFVSEGTGDKNHLF